MTSLGSVMLLLVSVLFVCLPVTAHERDMVRPGNGIRRQRPRLMRHRIEALRRNHLHLNSLNNASDWARSFIPEVPSAEDVDCYIEVTEEIGGRCIRLGGGNRMAVCQSGMYLDVESEVCQYILAAREMNEMNEERQNIQQQMEQITPAAETGVAQPESELSEQQQQQQ